MVQLRFKPYGKAEDTFNFQAVKLCEDKVAVKLGELFNEKYNSYILSDSDFEAVKDIILPVMKKEEQQAKDFKLLVTAAVGVMTVLGLYYISERKG